VPAGTFADRQFAPKVYRGRAASTFALGADMAETRCARACNRQCSCSTPASCLCAREDEVAPLNSYLALASLPLMTRARDRRQWYTQCMFSRTARAESRARVGAQSGHPGIPRITSSIAVAAPSPSTPLNPGADRQG